MKRKQPRPRMTDLPEFASGERRRGKDRSATACETALWPAGRFAGLRGKSQGSDREGIIDADPVAACVRAIMAERSSWTGSAADLLRAGAAQSSTDWPKNPRGKAGRGAG